MSKKLAEDLTHLVLDVKFGSGAFMKSPDKAEELARLLMTTGEHHNVQVVALLSSMDQPLGRFIGNSLEVKECLEIMQGKSFEVDNYDYYERTKELSLQLSAHMIYLAKKTTSFDSAYELAQKILNTGQAYDAFLKLCQYQGSANVNQLPEAKIKKPVLAQSEGYVHSMDVEAIGWAAISLGAGRLKSTDTIDYSAGFETNCHIGKKISKGDPLFYIYSNKEEPISEVENEILKSINISEKKTKEPPLVKKVLS